MKGCTVAFATFGKSQVGPSATVEPIPTSGPISEIQLLPYAALIHLPALDWWRRGELNPRPKSVTARSLHACLNSFGSARHAQNEQETQLTSPIGSRRLAADRDSTASLLCDVSDWARRRSPGKRNRPSLS